MEQTQTTPHGLFANDPRATASDPPLSCQTTMPPGSYVPAAGPLDWKAARHPSAEDWENVKDTIHDLYVQQKKPLRVVRNVLLERFSIKASDRMIKSRLKPWGFVKNAKREDWGVLAVMHDRRKHAGKHSTVFNVHGQRKTVKDLHRFIRNQNQTVEDFLAEHRNLDQVPEYIRAWTPDVEDDIRPDSPPSTTDPPTDVWSPSPTQILTLSSPSRASPYGAVVDPPSAVEQLPWRSTTAPSSVAGTLYQPPPTQLLNQYPPFQVYHPMYQHSNASDFGQLYSTRERDTIILPSINASMQLPHQIPTPPISEPCHQMDAELEACGTQLLKPQRLVSAVGQNDLQLWSWIYQQHGQPDMNDVQICSRCKQPSQRHFRSLDALEPVRDSPNRNLLNDCDGQMWHLPVSTRDEGAWLWVSRCFLACMCFSRGDEKMGNHALQDAVAHFEKLLDKRDRLLLTAALLMMAILHMHDQATIAFRILKSAKQAADRHFENEPSHPVRTTMAYFMHSANLSLASSGITSATLETAYLRLKSSYLPNHPYVIAARTNFSWMLKYEDKLEDAERHLREVYSASCAVFGEDHMQSVIALSLIAGCLSPQAERRAECVGLYQEVVARTADTLGVSHPYRLEAKRRLADKLMALGGREAEVLQLHKEVLWGRAKMLGRGHMYTLGARQVYEQNLKDARMWVDDQTGEPTGERVEVEDLFIRDPQDAWITAQLDAPSTRYKQSIIVPVDEGRVRIQTSISRTPSPTKSDDYAAY